MRKNFAQALFFAVVLFSFRGVMSENKISFKENEACPGYKKIEFFVGEKKELAGFLTLSYGKILKSMASFSGKALQGSSSLPKESLVLFKIINSLLKSGFDFTKAAMVGGLYVYPNFRGKGCAKKLLNHACNNVSKKQGISNVFLIPDPFERNNGVEKSLRGSSDYDKKRKKLVSLYKNCGFVESKAKDYMFKNI